MDSVYKLTKYSQKITDACKNKQYEKIGLYNKHENLYIKKLNEYFCNQKGGADMTDVTTLFERMAHAVNAMREGLDHNAGEVLQLRQQLQGMDELRQQLQGMEQELEGMGQLRQHLRSTEEQLGTAVQEKNDTEQRSQKTISELTEKHIQALARIEAKGEGASKEASDAIVLELVGTKQTILDLQTRISDAQLEIERLKRTSAINDGVLKQTQTDLQREKSAHEKAQSDLRQAQSDLVQEISAHEKARSTIEQAQSDLQVAQGAREKAQSDLEQALLAIDEQDLTISDAVIKASAPLEEQIASLEARLLEITQKDEANIRSLEESLRQANVRLAAHGVVAHRVNQRGPAAAAAAEETETASEKQDRLALAALERAQLAQLGGARRRR